MDTTLFRAVDVGEVEASVLKNAERRARNATIPKFVPSKALGFSSSSLGKFCSAADSLILRMVADSTRQETRELREDGVANLAARDRVQMKEQIIKGLLLVRHGLGKNDLRDEQEPSAAVNITNTEGALKVAAVSHPSLVDDEWQRREDLIRAGAVTPLDSVTNGAADGAHTRARMTLMDHKVAEGMTIELPRPRGRKTKGRSTGGGRAHALHDSGGSLNEIDGFEGSSTFDSPRLERGDGEADLSKTELKSARTGAPMDSDERVCKACDSLRSSNATECPTCSERRPRLHEASVALRGDASGGAMKRGLEQRASMSEIATSTVECPVCAQHVAVDDPRNPDAALSNHMDRCTRRRERTRSDTPRSRDHTNEGGSARSNARKSGLRTRSSQVVDATRDPTSESPGSVFRGSGHRKAADAKERKAAKPDIVRQKETSAVPTDATLKVLPGSQPLVDDFDVADFETRKGQVADVLPSDVVGDSNGSDDGTLDLGDGLAIKSAIAERLFQFQLTGVRWMWQLHRQGAGGIVGDEMGLGKTVQVASFLGALHGSQVLRRALILCPATVLSHWMAELHTWAPQLRVVVLHRCVQAFNAASSSSGKVRSLIRQILSWPDVVVVTSYEGMKALKGLLLPCNWDYCILDEGQRIRNPDAEVTLTCKQIRTVHRLVLTGTPIQNNLRELWSLFDFVFPGRLGTLPAFEAEFANPIKVGGYANASPMQARLAYRCALVLRDLIHPYLLRRQKKDLEDIIRLPAKTEQVLFCRLTSYQRQLYAEFLASGEVKRVLSRTMRAFRAIGILRKLCNHPDLVCRVGDSVVSRFGSNDMFGGPNRESGSDEDVLEAEGTREGREQQELAERSGKLLVLKQILPLWHEQGHRVLLFSQTRQMLNIIEDFVQSFGWSYGRLDGSTPVGTRQTLINRFNTDESMFIMLLTTRTGGVGINLTGADRVILFDPDWNPSTDMQARERSWRVGQLRQVTVYRLITAGTIEEKIYHRQIFKTALTNRVLQDPKQRRIFSADELGDLFTLGDDGSLDGLTDTVDLFQGEGRIDAPNGERRATRRKHSGQRGGSQKKRSRKGDKGPRIGSAPLHPEEQSEDSSPLLGMATIVIQPEDGEDADGDRTRGNGDDGHSKGDDTAVLQALYDGTSLSSAFHHDLAEGSGFVTVEQKRMEEAAKRAAQRAVNQLRMSRQTLRAGAGQGGFQSTWTGRNGGVGSNALSRMHGMVENQNDGAPARARPRFGTISSSRGVNRGGSPQQTPSTNTAQHDGTSGPVSVGGMTSQDILRQIRSRSGTQPVPSPALFPEFQEPNTSQDKDAFYSSLLHRLQDYLANAPSGVDTGALIQAFADVPSGDVPVFRQLLQAVAICTNGEWVLRDTDREE